MAVVPRWTEITVDEDLLPAVIKDLLALANDPNDVHVAHAPNGRIIVARAELAEAWFDAVNEKNEADDFGKTFEVVANEEIEEANSASSETEGELVQLPVKRGPGRPRKVQTPPLSDGEERAS